MRVSDAFPSDYLKASDLRGKDVKIIISAIDMEDIGGDRKPVVWFNGTDKKLVLNKTNANNIAGAYGDEMDAWIGKPIILFPMKVDFQGRTVDAIRVRAPTQPDPAPPINDPAGQGPTDPNAPPF